LIGCSGGFSGRNGSRCRLLMNEEKSYRGEREGLDYAHLLLEVVGWLLVMGMAVVNPAVEVLVAERRGGEK